MTIIEMKKKIDRAGTARETGNNEGCTEAELQNSLRAMRMMTQKIDIDPLTCKITGRDTTPAQCRSCQRRTCDRVTRRQK